MTQLGFEPTHYAPRRALLCRLGYSNTSVIERSVVVDGMNPRVMRVGLEGIVVGGLTDAESLHPSAPPRDVVMRCGGARP